METKKTKYDTNPLDPDFVRKTEEVWTGEGGGPPTQEVGRATHEIGNSPNQKARANVYSEAPTRRYDNVAAGSYPSVFVPPPYSQPVAQPQTTAYRPLVQKPTSRTVPGIGLPENWAMILPYLPFFIGIVASLLELFLVPRKELRVRFHAAQGLALHAAIIAIQTLFGLIGLITNSSIGGKLFSVATTIFLIISIIRVWKGEPHYISPLGEPSEWFNEHIEPRNKS